MFHKWKVGQDKKLTYKLLHMIMKKFWFDTSRKDFVLALTMDLNWSNEELVQLSNKLGQLAHERERIGYDASKS